MCILWNNNNNNNDNNDDEDDDEDYDYDEDEDDDDVDDDDYDIDDNADKRCFEQMLRVALLVGFRWCLRRRWPHIKIDNNI